MGQPYKNAFQEKGVYRRKEIMLHAFSRSEELLGKEGLKCLADSRVAVFGIGGVGTYVVEALARAGDSDPGGP